MAREHAEYDRISEDKSGSERGVASQHEENSEWSELNGRVITRRYSDNDISAYSGVVRPDFERLMRDVQSGLVGSVCVWHANRLLRSTEDATEVIRLFRKHKVTLYSVTRDGAYNLELASGRRDLRRDVNDAEYESDHRGERVAVARRRQARNGDYGGGVRPFGWGVDTGRVRSVCVNPKAPAMDRVYEDRPVMDMTRHNDAEAKEIRQWATDTLAGVPMNQILRSLAERGVKTVAETDGRVLRRDGKTVKHQGWNTKTVRQILVSPRTSGHAVYKGEIIRRNAFPAIIEDHVRLALVAHFADPARKTAPGNTPRWLGSLIYRCGYCDDGATVSVRKNSAGIDVYRCREKGHLSWPAEMVDRHVENVIVGLVQRDNIAALLPEREEIDIAPLVQEIKTLEQRKNTAAAMWMRTGDQEMLETAQAAADERISEIRAILNETTDESPLSDYMYSADARKTWHSQTLGRRRETLRRILVVTLPPIGRGRKASLELVRIDRAGKAA